MVDHSTTHQETPAADKVQHPPHSSHKVRLIFVVILIIVVIVVGVVLLIRHNNNDKLHKAKVQKQLTFTQSMQKAGYLSSHTDYSKALSQLQATKTNSSAQEFSVLIQEGTVYYQQKNYSAALSTLLKAYNLEPSQTGATTIANIAAIYAEMGNKTAAISYYNKAITAAQNSPQGVDEAYIPDYQSAITSLGGN